MGMWNHYMQVAGRTRGILNPTNSADARGNFAGVPDDGRLSDRNARHVGDGVEGSSRQDSHLESEVRGAWTPQPAPRPGLRRAQ